MHIKIDAALVQNYITKLATYGAYGDTGVWRTAYSPEWVQATNQYASWCEEAGLSVNRDSVGNTFGVLKGSASGGSIASGSHIDTQRPGGKYDGALGALAALIAIRSLKEQFGTPKRTLEAIAFCEEEGSRFPTAHYWGSSAIIGRASAQDPETMKDFEGETMANAMRAVGLDPTKIKDAKRNDIDTFLELHVEQGPVLEHAGFPVAVIDAITGIRHYKVTLFGVQNHAGAFPMDLRRDPMAGFAEIASGLIDTAHRMGRPAVTTVGRIHVEPNFPAVVPASVAFFVDARHPHAVSRAELYKKQAALIKEVADRRGLQFAVEVLLDHAPCPSDPGLVTMLQKVCEQQGVRAMTMASGAGHDSQQMAEIAKVAMIFVRSKDGRSHTQEEFSSIEDIVEGIRVLAGGMYQLAY